ncbi:DUF1127 domain-containing protein [Dongia sp.]|uniref:DUF1127 domain-containing protein n=1 Tax=Dongia sp. TaxID=1977262 RepID=UPI0035B2BBA0
MRRSLVTIRIRGPRVAASSFGVWPSILIASSRRLLTRTLSEHRTRRDIKTLSTFSDHMLADIGLGRADIEHTVRCGVTPSMRCHTD